MNKGIVKNLLFVLLCFLVSSATWAQNYVTPSLDNDDEISVFLISPDQNATYTLYGYRDGQGIENWPGTAFVKKGQMADGKYLYKWTLSPTVTTTPQNIIIYKNGSGDDNKIYADKPFVNHAIIKETVETKTNNYVSMDGEVTQVATGSADDPLAVLQSEDEKSVFFESPNDDTYHIWPYDDSKNHGGDYFTGVGWPGGSLTKLGQLSNGNYLYKWVQTTNVADTAVTVIFNWGDGNDGKQWNGLDFKYHGLYVHHNETVTADAAEQTGRVYPTDDKTSNLDPLATIDADDEVSYFLESDADTTYYIWPYDGSHQGTYFSSEDGQNDGKWPGAKLTKVGKLQTGKYLYKWTQNPHITVVPANYILSYDGSHKITPEGNDPAFVNHGYNVLTSSGTVNYQEEVTRRSDGSYATNRTNYGQRVIYELNIGAFTTEGTFAAAQKQLSYIKNLGVDVIWLMPVYERGGSLNSPYAVKDYYKTNPNYGDVNALKDFVTAAHQNGMDVWLDFVPNHTATDNAWVTSHPEWYKKGADGKMVHPSSGGTTFDDLYQLDYTYQDVTLNADGDTLKSINPVSEEMRNILKFWVDNTDIDGFRFDMVSSREMPNAFWTATTAFLKNIKPSLQFLAEADFSGDDGTHVSSANFQYDYAWWLNDKLRAWGKTPNQAEPAYRELNEKKTLENGEDNPAYNPSADPTDLAHITNSFLLGSNNDKADRMVYLINHDKNYGTDPNEKYTMKDICGDNRYAMTVYEFTMPGMPLIYNGQEQNGSFQLNYFTDEKIQWTATEDELMAGLIRELAHMKHTNNALNDGNNNTLRGETRIINSYNHNVLVYERVKGDQHVLVALNFANSAQNAVVVGATNGQWTRVISGSSTGSLGLSPVNETIGDRWEIVGIPAHGYYVYTYTGESQHNTEGIYFVCEDSKNNPSKHKMVLTGSDSNYKYYRFTIDADNFDALNTEEGQKTPGDQVLSFKFQEYYNFVNTVCRKDAFYGAGSVDSTIVKNSTLDFHVDATNANKYFNLKKGTDVNKYIITFERSQANSDEGKVMVEIVHANDIQKGYYLLTPINEESNSAAEKHQWRFNDKYEDQAAVSDKYFTVNNGDYVDLCSYTIDASQFDSYIPSERKAANAIQFRIKYYDGKNDNSGDIDPASKDADNDKSTFDPRKGDYVYGDAHWDAYADNPAYFKIVARPDVDKYIIQLWRTGTTNDDKTVVRVYYKLKYNYVGSTVDAVQASGEDVYLYNVDAQKFLYVGNTWGTMASLLYDDLGTRLNISAGKTSENTEYKTIRTRLAYGNDANSTKNQLGIDDWSYNKYPNDHFYNLDWDYIYCDRDNGNRWLFEKADSVDYANTYTLRLYNEKDGRFHFIVADHKDGKDEAAKRQSTYVKYIAQDSRTLNAEALNNYLGNNKPTYLGDRIADLGKIRGKVRTIEYTYNADYAGTYALSIKYLTRAKRTLALDVNDDHYERDAHATGSYDNIYLSDTLNFKVHLNKGKNTITIGNQESLCPNIVSLALELERPDDLKYGRWQIVTYNDLWNKLKNENSELYGGTSADATFLLKDQGFTRNVPVTWDNDNGTNGSNVKLTKNTIGDYSDVGMYWNGHITGKGNIYQDIDVPMYGIYQFDAYGFASGSQTVMFYQYAKSKNADGSYVWSDTTTLTTPLKEATIAYNGRNSDISTGQMFYQESVLNDNPEYLNTCFISIPDDAYKNANGNYRLRIGFYKKDDKPGDYTAVDDVHLHYNGKATFILDETWNKTTLDGKMNDDRSNVPVWLKRKFYANVWNTLIVPVAVSTTTLRSIFGDNVEVASPYGLDDNNPYLIRFTPVDLTSGSIAIEPGKYYIVRPNKLVGTSKVLDMQGSKPVLETVTSGDKVTRFYNLGLHDLNDLRNYATVEPMGVKTLNFNFASKNDSLFKHNAIQFVGSYHTFHMPDSCYAFTSKGRVVQLINGVGADLNGYRFYIQDINNPGKKSSAAKVSFAMGSLDDDLDAVLNSFGYKDNGKDGGTTTGIHEINTNDAANVGDGIVYDLSGRRVADNGDTLDLPKGVYIINGKKFVKN